MSFSTGGPSAGSDAELRDAIVECLAAYSGVVRDVVQLERCNSLYSSSFWLEEIDVHLDDGNDLRLIFKDLGPGAVHESAQRAKPAFLYDPMREIEAYRLLVAPANLGTAIFYGAAVDPDAERYWLFLERVPGVELFQKGEFQVWRFVASWLSRMHTRFSQDVMPLNQEQAAHLIRYDADLYRTWLDRARALGSHAAAPEDVRGLMQQYESLIDRLASLPVTVIHGEFYASNILIDERDDGPLRVCPVDWETVAVGPGLMDVAALIAGSWSESEKRALALTYFQTLSPESRAWSDADTFLADLDCCRLHIAVQWLGWSSNWMPPPQRTYDWLGEAMRVARRIRG